MKYNKDEVYVCESEPWRSKVITFVDECLVWDSDSIDEEMSMISWQVSDEKAFDKRVCEYKKKDTIQEVLANDGNTFPYVYYGEMTYKSWKNYISRHKMRKLD